MALRLVADPVASTPLERLVDDYLNSCRARGVAAKTDQQYSTVLRRVFLTWCREEEITDVSQLTRRVLDRFTASLLTHRTERGTELSRHTVHTYIRPVRLLLNWAAREGEEVTAKPQFPSRPKPVRDVLSREEIDLMERMLPMERDRVIIRVFGDCGLRLNELCGLKATDILRSGRQAHLRVLGKRSRVRDVPVPPGLLRRLERLVESRPRERTSDHIFISVRRTPMGDFDALTTGGVYLIVKDAVARAGLTKRVYPHLLRHSWMTEMLRNGMSPVQLSFIAGASMEVIANHYAHLTKDDAYEAMMRVLVQSSRR